MRGVLSLEWLVVAGLALVGLASAPPVVAQAEVLTGIDVLQRQQFAPLRGLRLGLITNHTGVDRQRRSTIDVLRAAPGVQLKALFTPEHGLRGDNQYRNAQVDERTGLPVYNAHGLGFHAEQLRDLDALVFDIQDIGTRFYTYVHTMGEAMQAAAQAKIRFFVLDRPNPVTGLVVEGEVSPINSFHALPLRHGMTAGELARMFNAERKMGVDLTVIPMEGWFREQWFDATGLPWTNPSPNMRNLTAATLYPGVGLLENAVSVAWGIDSLGRRSDSPFEVIGAPYVDDVRLAAELNRAALPGIRFVPIRFTPTAREFQGQLCGGVYMLVLDRDALRPVDVGLLLIAILQRLYPKDFELRRVRFLTGETIAAIRAGKSFAEIKQRWTAAQQDFSRRRERFLLYPVRRVGSQPGGLIQ